MTATFSAPSAVSTPIARSARRGTVLVLVSATGFGMSAVFAKQAYAAGFNVPTMLSGRFVLAAVLLWAVVAWRRAPLPRGRALAVCVGLGALGYALQAGFYFGALAQIDASLTALLLYAYPALVTVLAIALRRERPDRRRLAALGCSAVGMLLMLGAGGVGGAAATGGVLLALGAAVAYALYLTVSAGLPAGLDIFAVTAVVCTSAAASLAAAGLATGTLHAPHQASGWVWIALLAVVSTVVPIAGMFVGVRDVGASAAAILSCAEPAVTVATTALVYGERLSPMQALGGLAVVSSVAVLQLRRRATRPHPALQTPEPATVAATAPADAPAEAVAAPGHPADLADAPAEVVAAPGRGVRRRLARLSRRARSAPAAGTRPPTDPAPNRRDQRAPHHPAQR
ncbi:DMT family transporter [Catellatospora vulcania]|uniref:DMT family transporter n=1 Tax=Catellatospora vulcania TaxID=1460450 RepID=UPI0018AFF45E|nr:DMT family transporter [Catellatospora vulcania]